MEIKIGTAGPNQPEYETVETDKLNDVDSAILEKAEELRLLCSQYNVNISITLETSKEILASYSVKGEPERLMKFWEGMNKGLFDFSNGLLRMVFIPSVNE